MLAAALSIAWRGNGLRTFGLYCGIVSPIIWLALIAAAGTWRPDFSHVTNYISELAERGSATEALMRYGAFEFTGLLYVCFAAALLSTLRNGRLATTIALLIALEGIGRTGAGVFPCDPGCVQISSGPDLHKLFATIGFCSGIAAAGLSAPAFRDIPVVQSISRFSLGSSVVALIALLVMVKSAELGLPAGLFEHLATVTLSLWVLVFASRLIRAEHGGSRAGAPTGI